MTRRFLFMLIVGLACFLAPNYVWAKLYFLPDYQQSFDSRTNAGGGGDKDVNCSDYAGGVSSCPSPKVGTKIVGTSCVKDCKCPNGYKYTDLICQSDFGSGYKAGPNLCDGKANNCVPKGCVSGSTIKPTCAKGFEAEEVGVSGSDKCYASECKKSLCVAPLTTSSSCLTGFKAVDSGARSGTDICYRCDAQTCSEKCGGDGYVSGKTCEKGMTTLTCDGCSGYVKCSGSACPTNLACSSGCQNYSKQAGCGDVCIECKACVCSTSGYKSTACTAEEGVNITPMNDSCGNANVCHRCSITTCNTDGYKLLQEHTKPVATPGRTPKYYDQNGNVVTASLMQMKNITLAGRMLDMMSVNSAYAAISNPSSSLDNNQVMPARCPASCRPGDCRDLYHARSECCPCEPLQEVMCSDGFTAINGKCVENPILSVCQKGYIKINGVCVEQLDLSQCILGYKKNQITGKCDKVCTVEGTVMIGDVCLPTVQEFEFKVSDTCTHDSKYVKGQWIEKPLTCETFGMIAIADSELVLRAQAHTVGGLTNCQPVIVDKCVGITEVTVPADATCTGTHIDCPDKCTAWTCNKGFNKIGDKCVKDLCPTEKIRINSNIETHNAAANGLGICPSDCLNCNDYYVYPYCGCLANKKQIQADIDNYNGMCPDNKITTILKPCPTKALCGGGSSGGGGIRSLSTVGGYCVLCHTFPPTCGGDEYPTLPIPPR